MIKYTFTNQITEFGCQSFNMIIDPIPETLGYLFFISIYIDLARFEIVFLVGSASTLISDYE